MLTGIATRLIETDDGDAALAAVAENDVDLVLADVRMPGMDGTALLDRLPVSLPVILITGLDIHQPPRAAALLRKDELTRERLAFTIRRVSRETR
jgi:CheY-like chemotaxis protein